MRSSAYNNYVMKNTTKKQSKPVKKPSTKKPASKPATKNMLFAEHARPKMITVNFVRKGSKYLVENGVYLHEINQYAAGWERLDARELRNELVAAARTGDMVAR